MKDFGTYPEDWSAIAERLKTATGWRCERCGHPDSPDLARAYEVRRGLLPCDSHCTHINDGKQRVLTVHHLDRNKSNCEPWNLAVLCQVCHLQIQGKVDFYKDYAMPHTPWMAPHVEGRDAARSAGKWPVGVPL